MTTSNIAGPDCLLSPPSKGALRLALASDATVTGLNGLVYLVGAEALAGLFGLDPGLLRGSGGFLLAFGLTVGALARRPRPLHVAVWIVVGINVVWAMVGLLVAVVGWGSPSPVGTVWIIGQALLICGFAARQATAVTHQRVQS